MAFQGPDLVYLADLDGGIGSLSLFHQNYGRQPTIRIQSFRQLRVSVELDRPRFSSVEP